MSDFKLLEVAGIELEYMVVDKENLSVMPIVDALFEKILGKVENVVEGDSIDWSNELVRHVLEFKNPIPTKNILDLVDPFANEVNRANKLLEGFGAELLPTAMHPLMNPHLETKLWPYGNQEIYNTYDRIFSCKGHGWSNLQSMHINLSFSGDKELSLLNNAIRMILPLIPALSASSPLVEGEFSPYASTRLTYYMKNQQKVPSIAGDIVPEFITSKDDYEKIIFQPMYKEIAPYDTEGILQEEWLNSRGAIAKFDQGCIEIRLCDLQEAPVVDLSIAHFWIEQLKIMTSENTDALSATTKLSSPELKKILLTTIESGEKAIIENKDYLSFFGVKENISASELLHLLRERLKYTQDEYVFEQHIKKLLKMGTLSTRLRKSIGAKPSVSSLQTVYHELAECLKEGRMFEG